MQFTDLAAEEAAFILNVLAKLPTESNVYPLFKRLESQFQAQQDTPSVEPVATPAE